jgi:hypothetical protein
MLKIQTTQVTPPLLDPEAKHPPLQRLAMFEQRTTSHTFGGRISVAQHAKPSVALLLLGLTPLAGPISKANSDRFSLPVEELT